MIRKLLHSRWLYYAPAALLAVLAVASQFEIHWPSRPTGGVEDIRRLRERDDLNVVFVLVDTLRADHLGCYGYERDTSPTIDLLAASGVRFARVQAQSSWTKASMASLWTGAYPRTTGVLRFHDGIPEAATLPAEILREAGFRTGGIYRNGWVANNFGFDQGFEMYFRPTPSRTPEKFQRHNPSAHPLKGTDLDATESALEFLRHHARERFFLYLHYMDVHQYLYDEASTRFGTDRAAAYDNAIHWTDTNVGILFGELERLDLLDRTIVVIASDHGEGFQEHGVEGHARTLYREVTKTPWILVLPFRLEPGLVIETPVQNVDLWPTLLDLMGLGPLPGAEGRSLVPLIESVAAGSGEAVDGLADRTFFAQLDRSWGLIGSEPRPLVAVRRGHHHLIHDGTAPEAPELYDWSTDPRERHNLAAERAEVVGELRGLAEAYLGMKPAWESRQVEVDELRTRQLRALGYVLEEERKPPEGEG